MLSNQDSEGWQFFLTGEFRITLVPLDAFHFPSFVFPSLRNWTAQSHQYCHMADWQEISSSSLQSSYPLLLKRPVRETGCSV